MIASTTLLNRIGHALAQDDDVHGITDVTGFGLLGHGLELARGGNVHVTIDQKRIPFLAKAEALAETGYITGASGRNWESYGDQVILPKGLPAWRRALLTDPQTSGGPARGLQGGAGGGHSGDDRSGRLPARQHRRHRQHRRTCAADNLKSSVGADLFDFHAQALDVEKLAMDQDRAILSRCCVKDNSRCLAVASSIRPPLSP